MVVIRLSRTGGNKTPFYHVVVADQRRSRDGRFIERIGYYNPMARGQDLRLQLEEERIDYWLSKGAKASDRVNHLIKELKKSPDEAQKAAPSRSEAKKAQLEQSLKAQKKAETEAKKAEAESAKAEEKASAEEPKEDAAKADADKEAK